MGNWLLTACEVASARAAAAAGGKHPMRVTVLRCPGCCRVRLPVLAGKLVLGDGGGVSPAQDMPHALDSSAGVTVRCRCDRDAVGSVSALPVTLTARSMELLDVLLPKLPVVAHRVRGPVAPACAYQWSGEAGSAGARGPVDVAANAVFDPARLHSGLELSEGDRKVGRGEESAGRGPMCDAHARVACVASTVPSTLLGAARAAE
jgi:hypothetical protein